MSMELGYQLIEKALAEQNAITPGSMRNAMKFNRFRIRYPDHELERIDGRVFFTRPDLNLLTKDGNSLTDDAKNIPELYDFFRSKDIQLIRNLKIDAGNTPFMPVVTSYADSFDIPDIAMKTRVSSETSTEFKIVMGGRTCESKGAGTFNIKYTDERDLLIYKLHKIWIEYIDAVSFGTVSPKREYILKGILDYAVSAYCFLLAEDGETIVYYAKFTGVFPSMNQESLFAWDSNDKVKRLDLTLQYQYSFVEQMNPLIIKDFNSISQPPLPAQELKIYNTDTGTMGSTWAGHVGIEEVRGESGFKHYKLKYYR